MFKGTQGPQATRPQLLLERLRDEQSRRVVFVAHCILNENTRYLGGAFRAGAVEEVLEPWEGRFPGAELVFAAVVPWLFVWRHRKLRQIFGAARDQ